MLRMLLIVCADASRSSQHFFFSHVGRFLGCTSTKQRIKLLAQGYNTIPQSSDARTIDPFISRLSHCALQPFFYTNIDEILPAEKWFLYLTCTFPGCFSYYFMFPFAVAIKSFDQIYLNAFYSFFMITTKKATGCRICCISTGMKTQ